MTDVRMIAGITVRMTVRIALRMMVKADHENENENYCKGASEFDCTDDI